MNFALEDWARTAPACVFSHFSKGPQALICELLQYHPQDLQALLASYERRRLKGDRDPLLLDWMQGVTSAILNHKCQESKSLRNRPTVTGTHLASDVAANILAGLTTSQQAAVTSPADRALLVVAGAGSGKTKTLLARVRWLVASGQVTEASEILLLSFSRAACDELRQRLRALDRGLSAAVKVKTFHGFALDVFRSHRQALLCENVQELLPGRLLRVLQHDENLRVVGDWEQRLLLSAAIAKAEENGEASQKVTLPCALRYLQRRKGSGTVPENHNPSLTAVAEEYEKALDSNKSVDYADLISMAGEVLRLPVVAKTMAKLQAVVVDEFQDTSMAQLQMLQEMLSSRPSRLTAVGDPRQRIFSFQGSAFGQFKASQQRFHARELTLEENFRSTGHICGCATSILGQAGMDDLMHPEMVLSRHPAGNGMPVTVAVCRTVRCEEFHARSWVLQQKVSCEWRDLAILARTTATAQSMANSLQSLGVPVVLAGVEHYSQKEVQDVLAICRLLLNPADEHLLKHCLRAARVVTGGELVLLEAAMETGQEPSCIPSVTGADPDVTARLAKSLLGHPGRKARFLQGPLQDLSDLIRELRMALFPPGRAKGKAGKTNLHRPKDATLRACLLLNGVAFLENGAAVWPVLVCPCKCRASHRVAQAPKPFSNLCLRCGGLTLPAGQEAAGGEQHICCSKTCATCSQTIEDGDLVCQVCGQGQHLAADTACSGVPAGRGPMSFKRGPPSPWLCPSCYADFATAWWSRRLSHPDFPHPAASSIQAVLRRMLCSATPLNLPRSTLWALCDGLAAGSPPQWLSKQVWRQLRRFVKVISDLSGRLHELRLPELVSRVFRVLPWSRRYRGYQASPTSPGLAEALRAEAEYHLQTSRKGSDSAAAELLNFLERLDLEGAGPFSATAAGSGTAEAGRGRDAVTIATAHASKGRQWKHVLVTRFNDGFGFPFQGKWGSSEDQLQEEQRLAYVATSRACETLTLSYVLQGPDLQPAVHSRFLPRSNLFRMIAVEHVRHEDLQSLAGQVFEGGTRSSERWQKFLANPRKPGSAMAAKRRFQSKIQRNGAKRRRTTQV